jgi:flavin reductase (DIM6/NTAB) family NADH-FMN oxidoreductase RutF
MKKRSIKPSTFLAPVPAALVTCQDKGGRPNIITKFVVNLPTVDIIRKADHCGITSGKDSDKFANTGLTPVSAEKVTPPLIEECSVSLECRLTEIVPLGVHDMFLGEIVATHVADEAFDADGNIRMELINPLGYSPIDRTYRAIGDALGGYGYSRKEKT